MRGTSDWERPRDPRRDARDDELSMSARGVKDLRLYDSLNLDSLREVKLLLGRSAFLADLFKALREANASFNRRLVLS